MSSRDDISSESCLERKCWDWVDNSFECLPVKAGWYARRFVS